ncbi:MAG: tetratricopeptide repeat protein, partial [Acidimicrobiia bacterium]
MIKQAVLAAALGLVLAVAARAQVDVPTTYGDAMRWYGEAAEAGDAKAQFFLGLIYEEGLNDLPRNLAKAAEWYRKAARQGHVMAQFKLAVLYEHGEGGSQDLAEAVRWY